MKRNRISQPVVGLIIVWSLGSCGGGGGSGPLADGGIGGTGTVISIGTISGFGSVFVNGVEFDTADAAISVDGELAGERDLGVGMVVAVEGTFEADGLIGNASRITYEELLEGPVEAIDPVGETLIVLGQTVMTSDATVFDGVNFETLALGSIVEVSGFLNSNRSIRATRIELKAQRFVPAVTVLEIMGLVENVDDLSKTFTIGGLLIDFGDAVLGDIPSGIVENGLMVEVESVVGVVNGTLIASRVRGQESILLADSSGLRVEIEGIVTDVTSLNDFVVGGIPVQIEAMTTFENGAAIDIAVDVRVEVEGVIDVDGVLVADEIEFDLEGAIEIEADVESVDLATRTLVLLGIPVAINNLTIIWDQSDADAQPFGLENIQLGDRLAVVGNQAGGAVVAIRVERRNPEGDVALKGPVTAISGPALLILGVLTFVTDETAFEDSNDRPISADDFFAVVKIGAIVEVEGILTSGNVIIADELEIAN